ncbi:phosphoribosylglycinamide formyltransferase [bacterium]|nr:phosphoribosylglycinamide formyltransferase [bacterium]
MAKRETKPINLAVLLSGSGTTLENFIKHIDAGKLDAKIQVVVSSRPKVRGLEIARDAGIETRIVSRKKNPDEREFSRKIDDALNGFPIDLICFAGFMSKYFAHDRYFGKIINIHPALIPMFCGEGYYGHYVHESVLNRGVQVSGCTVHIVDDEYDHGPIVAQRVVPVLEDDTPDTLAARVQAEERRLYPQVIQWFAEGRVRVKCGKVYIEGRSRSSIMPEK